MREMGTGRKNKQRRNKSRKIQKKMRNKRVVPRNLRGVQIF
jgi:hypothetical protein